MSEPRNCQCQHNGQCITVNVNITVNPITYLFNARKILFHPCQGSIKYLILKKQSYELQKYTSNLYQRFISYINSFINHFYRIKRVYTCSRYKILNIKSYYPAHVIYKKTFHTSSVFPFKALFWSFSKSITASKVLGINAFLNT